MLRKERELNEVIANMKSLGEMLVPYNYPRTPLILYEDSYEFFKERDVVVDGYSLIIHYQKSDYKEYFLKTFQIHNKTGPFLPFYLVAKMAKKFLGSEYLSLVEIFKDSKKIYCWSVAVDENDVAIETPYEIDGEKCSFEGFEYIYMSPESINFY